jgi:hypothetical protein
MSQEEMQEFKNRQLAAEKLFREGTELLNLEAFLLFLELVQELGTLSEELLSRQLSVFELYEPRGNARIQKPTVGG